MKRTSCPNIDAPRADNFMIHVKRNRVEDCWRRTIVLDCQANPGGVIGIVLQYKINYRIQNAKSGRRNLIVYLSLSLPKGDSL
jgi:hypothetical protein